MNVLLISTYELGRQPFGLASPAAWLRQRGHRVTCLDLSRQALQEDALRATGLIAFYVPMHTAARIALQLVEPFRRLNPAAQMCAYGLYAPLTADAFRQAGVDTLFGGEFEQSLVDLADRVAASNGSGQGSHAGVSVSLARQRFTQPDRSGLPPLRQYAHVVMPDGAHRVAGYTEASRGCKHLCRHCPVVPVYNGVFRIVDAEIVLADIRQQVAAGAQHITFGDPDFFNGVGHAIPLIRSMHDEFPNLTYDATIKIEHLRRHEKYIDLLRETGCLFVTSAVESLDDHVLLKLDKGHTREDFLCVAQRFRDAGLALHPTFIPFTPWTTLESFRNLLHTLSQLDFAPAVAPIQLGIRLLIPARSRLLELSEIQQLAEPFDPVSLVHPWRHRDPRLDALCEQIQDIAAASEKSKESRIATFERIWRAADEMDESPLAFHSMSPLASRAAVPYLNEPWYC